MYKCFVSFFVQAHNHLNLSGSAVLAETPHQTNPDVFNLWPLFLINLNNNVII